MNRRPIWLLAAAALLFGSVTRFYGHGRDLSHFVLPERVAEYGIATDFYEFHPDEETLVRAALQLETPLNPPLTVYGLVPVYLVRAVLATLSFVHDADLKELATPQLKPLVFKAVRWTSACLSTLCLVMVFYIGAIWFRPSVAVLATTLFAAFPIAIQLAHYFTVDGVFAFLATISTTAFLWAVRSGHRRAYVIAGVCIGLVASVRLNGLALMPILLIVHCCSNGQGSLKSLLACALAPKTRWAVLATITTVLVLQPYMVFDPELLLRAESSDDFGFSMLVTNGEILRPWSLFDTETAPFTHYLVELVPLATGWPFACLMVPATVVALLRGGPSRTVCATWILVYFVTIGGQHTKHVRYLLPMLPFAALLVADMCATGMSKLRPISFKIPAFVGVAGVMVYTVLLGAAFTNIYSKEDSRIATGRWVGANVPHGTVIGLERGGFSVRSTISDYHHHHLLIETGSHFGTRGYLSCRAAARALGRRLMEVDYLIIAEENRSWQFQGAADQFPVVSAFYRDLISPALGFEIVSRFKQQPTLFGVVFEESKLEPSFTGYDHPTVLVLKKINEFTEKFAVWSNEVMRSNACADPEFENAAASLKQDRLESAGRSLDRIREQYPDAAYALLLKAERANRLGRQREEKMALEQYMQGYADPSRSLFLIPWAAASSYVWVGLYDMALSALKDGVHKSAFVAKNNRRKMASSYIDIANSLYVQNEFSHAEKIYQFANSIRPESTAHNALALIAYQRQHYESAASHWISSLDLDPNQDDVHKYLGEVTGLHLRDKATAAFHLRQALRLNPSLKSEIARIQFNVDLKN